MDDGMETRGLIQTAIAAYRSTYEAQQVVRAQLDAIDLTDVADAVEQAWQCEGTAREDEAERLLKLALEAATRRWEASKDPEALLRGIDEEYGQPAGDDPAGLVAQRLLLDARPAPALRLVQGGGR